MADDEDNHKGDKTNMEQEDQEPKGSGPLPGLIATPSQYDSVIEDLRQRGLEDLASEILRLTAIGDDEEDEKEIEKTGQGATMVKLDRSLPAVSRDRKSGTESAVSHNSVTIRPPAPQVTSGQEAGIASSAAATTRQPYASKEGTGHQTDAKASGSNLAVGVPEPPTSAAMTPIGLASEEKHRAHLSGHAPNNSSRAGLPSYLIEPVLGERTTFAMATPTRLLRSTASENTEPGAYCVVPSNNNATNGTESTSGLSSSDCNLMNIMDESLSSASSFVEAAEEGRSTELQEEQAHSTDGSSALLMSFGEGSGALEAVRVDDIMTVKAEPLQEQPINNNNSNHKVIACVACAVVALVMILTIALTTTNQASDPVPSEAAGPQPYDAETRFRLMRELLIQRFVPIYQVNYDIDDNEGQKILEDALLEPESPQAQALEWISRGDALLETIVTKPMLDDLEESHSDTRSFILDGGVRRQLLGADEESLLIHDQIVQRYALAVLFFSTGNWTNPYEFLSAETECGWSGVIQCGRVNSDDYDVVSSSRSVDSTRTLGYITHLELPNNNLDGTLPLELGALTALQSLNLNGNALEGTLPPALAALTDLQHFDGGFNDFTGTIPETYYQNWRSLESWNLAECALSGTISSHIENMGQLKEMTWVRNNFAGAIPPQFWSTLTNMEVIDLAQQSVKFVNETISTEIGLWSNLRTFAIYGLDLRGSIPSEIGLLTHLELLQLASNHLSGTIPSELGLLTAMTKMSLSLNGISGTVPTEFLEFTSVTRLYLQNTLLTGDVSFLCEGIEEGVLLPMDPLRIDMGEVSGCSCCTCCQY